MTTTSQRDRPSKEEEAVIESVLADIGDVPVGRLFETIQLFAILQGWRDIQDVEGFGWS